MYSGNTTDFEINDLVRTSKKLIHSSYDAEARKNRMEDTVGRVISREDGHGHGDYLKVRHLDGTVGCYDPHEISLERPRKEQTLH